MFDYFDIYLFCPISFVGGYSRQFYFNKRKFYKNQRSQMNIPFKKRKLFDGCLSDSDCNHRRIVERISESTEKRRESSGLYLEIMESFEYGFLILLFTFIPLLMAYLSVSK